ncbi:MULTISPECIES: ABC transporter permease [Rhodopseudomonas]|uniref:ABC transporter permease n=1 Tax=Rhodopseudomonas telluris TaxID=644215 RepID=A0ABV6EZK2_9BRAD
MSDDLIIGDEAARGMGLTERQSLALEAVTKLCGEHGRMPSRSEVARELGCAKNNAVRLIDALVERGELVASAPHGPLAGFGDRCNPVAVVLPEFVSREVAAFCAAHGERVANVVADAIVLHLDQLKGAARSVS